MFEPVYRAGASGVTFPMIKGFSAIVSAALGFVFITGGAGVNSFASTDPAWQDTFDLEGYTLSSRGINDYFYLEPGYKLTLEGEEDRERIQLNMTVLDITKMVDGTETRVVEERESENGELTEISRNYFAMCKETGDIFYFGEEVDIYEDGEIVDHEGAWLAGENGARAGLIIPASPTVGMKYYQEVAPGAAEDRAEVISLVEVVDTPAGKFENVLKIEETNPLESDEKEYKFHAPKVGLIQDADLKLVAYVLPELEKPVQAELKSQPQSVTVDENEIEVQVNSSSTISNFVLDEENKKISFSVNGAGSTNGTTEIRIDAILEGPYTVTVDGEVMDNVELIESDETNSSIIKIAHADDSHVISVAGTNVVPEFPIHAIWIASLVGALIVFARFKAAGNLAGPRV